MNIALRYDKYALGYNDVVENWSVSSFDRWSKALAQKTWSRQLAYDAQASP